MINIFETQYQISGSASQRRYPNEQLIAFMARNFFSVPVHERKNIKVLEIGCGSGANLWFLAKEGFDVYGIDQAPTGIKYCEKMLENWGVKAQISIGDMKKMIFSDESFDAVADVVSMQHLTYTDHRQCYKEIYRTLKRGGKLFSFHLGENSVSYLHGGGQIIDKNTVDNISDKTKPLHDNGQTCFLAAADAKALLKEAGFKEITIDTIQRSYNNQEFTIEYLIIQAEK